MTHEGVNPSCGDELTLSLRVENGVIEEAAFTGHGCAVSASFRRHDGRRDYRRDRRRGAASLANCSLT